MCMGRFFLKVSFGLCRSLLYVSYDKYSSLSKSVSFDVHRYKSLLYTSLLMYVGK